MSSAQVEWQRAKTQKIGLRFNRIKDADVLDYLASTGAPLQTIRRLIRDEIARTGWQPATAPHVASLSLDGGTTWIPPEELPAAESAIAARWDDITAAMEPQIYDDISANYTPCPLPEFVRHYLEQSGDDLTV